MSSKKIINWILFVILCLIWGSSFILMKISMYDEESHPLLTPYQVAALRILSAGIVLLPSLIIKWKQVPFKLWKDMLLAGLLGSFFPAFLFCIAETKIDSALAGTLNSLTPIFVILTGIIIYKNVVPATKIWAILLGLAGSILLFVVKKHEDLGEIEYVGLIVFATFLYGVNVNIVQHKLKDVPSITIASFAFSALIIPCGIILWHTDYFSSSIERTSFLKASAAASTLGILGTAAASILFYVLLKRGGAIFASLVTYGIPFVALGWGIYYKEKITLLQIISLMIILSGVYLANMDITKIKKSISKIARNNRKKMEA